MPAPTASTPYICARCIRAQRIPPPPYQHPRTRPLVRRYAESAAQKKQGDGHGEHTREGRDGDRAEDLGEQSQTHATEKDEGAMTRRLRSMSDDLLTSDPRGASKTVEAAGFSEDLKRELEERIAAANFRTENRNAFAEIEISSRAGRGTRDIATADPWMGEESLHDASLRMLTDAHKPLRVPGGGRGRIPGPSAPLPKRVDTGRTARKGSGARLADARDRSGLYSSLKESDIDEQEKQKRFQELKDRFSPHARAVVPGTIQGLTSLANQKIEDAIARGQFKNLPSRGKKVERDYNASNPFLDTTEYFLNKMIQKQEIVPPWIEKQQELVAAATKFRTRLRLDWKRHAARMIASAGGSLEIQIRRAEAYAKAELIANPVKRKDETLNTVDDTGHISQISLSGELKVPESAPASSASQAPVVEEIIAARTSLDSSSALNADVEPSASQPSTTTKDIPTLAIPLPTPLPTASSVPPAPYPYRDEAWEATELSYLTLQIASLNSITRTYNLQAPALAKKPYFSLPRELKACYADVAPLLAGEIRDRALGARARSSISAGQAGGGSGVLEGLVGAKVKIRDEIEGKRYGFRQLWKDVFGGA